jgi:hypothetical protein
VVVLIVNLTDAPGKDPVQVDIYNKTLDPGAHIRIPAALVNAKIRALEKQGLIAIDKLPAWYEAAKKKKVEKKPKVVEALPIPLVFEALPEPEQKPEEIKFVSRRRKG